MEAQVRHFVFVMTALVALALPASAAARGHTIETVFHAFRADGTPSIHVQTRSGYCYSGSLAIDRTDAWRCFVGNFIYDPCFSSSIAPGEVVCPDLAITGGIEINLTRRLPRRLADSGRAVAAPPTVEHPAHQRAPLWILQRRQQHRRWQAAQLLLRLGLQGRPVGLSQP